MNMCRICHGNAGISSVCQSCAYYRKCSVCLQDVGAVIDTIGKSHNCPARQQPHHAASLVDEAMAAFRNDYYSSAISAAQLTATERLVRAAIEHAVKPLVEALSKTTCWWCRDTIGQPHRAKGEGCPTCHDARALIAKVKA